MTATCFQTGPWGALLMAAPGFLAFYMAHWQEYLRIHLRFQILQSLSRVGSSEWSNWSWSVCHHPFGSNRIFRYFIYNSHEGPAVWQITVVNVSGHNITLANGFTILVSIIALGTAIQRWSKISFNLNSIYDGLTLANKNKIRTLTALSQLIPLLSAWVSVAIWIYHSPSHYWHSSSKEVDH